MSGPLHVEGQPGRVLRDGTTAEAGLNPDASAQIDQAAEAWVRETGVGFTIIVARHGIVAHSKAYGPISQGPLKGSPFQLETIAPLASMTKFLGAILMLQFVDRGLVRFDDPAEKYLPALQGLHHENPPTIRDLYTHTAGLMGHWGDTLHDMEEYVADIYPTLRSASPQQYHGVGHALGGKIMESISGQSIPLLYRRFLTDPLQCTSLQLQKTSYGSFGAVGDLVRIGQMMLNGGVYGQTRFFTPETLAQMMPIPGRDRTGPDPAVRWGVGIKQMDNDGLSESAFGHSGATGSFLVVDPRRDLVLAHTRFEDGSTYEEFLRLKHLFIASILQTLA
jgi:CubicO group peptidase (beta-lactamase class C family)